MAERIYDIIKGLSPAERERRRARDLADRFDTIKPQLMKLGVRAYDTSKRDTDDRFITMVDLSFHEKNGEGVRDLLKSAGIREIYNPYAESAKWIVIGMFASSGLYRSREDLERAVTAEEITIYVGKNISQDDLHRLTTLDNLTPTIDT